MHTGSHTQSTSNQISLETHTVPHTVNNTHNGHATYDLLQKVITDTIYGDTPVDNNPHNTSSYWEGLNREVRLNKGRKAERLWEGNQDVQTQNSQDRYSNPIHNSGDDQQVQMKSTKNKHWSLTLEMMLRWWSRTVKLSE